MKRPLFPLNDTDLLTSAYDESKRINHPSLADSTNDQVLQTLVSLYNLPYTKLLANAMQVGSTVDGMAVMPVSVKTSDQLQARLAGGDAKLVMLLRPVDTIVNLNDLLCTANNMIGDGQYLCVNAMTDGLKKTLLKQRTPAGLRWLAADIHYAVHRMMPKLRLTKGLYFKLTGGKNRSMSRVEVLGRICRAGFAIIDERFIDGRLFVTARKVQAPLTDHTPSGSPIIVLNRVGKNGKEIKVYKFRTMFTYSEYLQDYVYQYQHLQDGGKFKADYRINAWGLWLRPLWLDELPMLWNWVKGDLKLVGVRPLSRQYFNLYSPEMQALRTKNKPGLMPPFYYDANTPSTLEEIQASERIYLEAYAKAPFRTDWRYFWGIVGNILFRHKTSK